MSADLVLNFEKSTSKSTSLNNSSTKSSDSSTKTEGSSLFDSLMNEAKKESTSEEPKANRPKVVNKDNVTSKETINNDKGLTLASNNNETGEETSIQNKKNDLSNINSSVNNKLGENLNTNSSSPTVLNSTSDEIEGTSNSKEIIEKSSISSKTVNFSNISDEDSSEESMKKLVDKLVNIVVSAAKDVLDSKNSKSINSSELTTTVEKIVENQITNIMKEDSFQNIVDKKLDIVSSSIKIIKSETDNILQNKTISDNQESTILDEVSTIKSSISTIKEELVKNNNSENTSSEPENDKLESESKETIGKDIKIVNKEITNHIEVKPETVDSIKVKPETIDEINSNLSIIDENSDEIEKLLIKDNSNFKNTNTDDSVESLIQKVEYKTNEIEESIDTIKDKVSQTVIVNTLKKENIESLSKIVESTNEIDESLKKPLLAAMFLTTQKITKEKVNLEQVKDAKDNILEKKSIESVKESANKLNLVVEDTEVSHEEEIGIKPVTKNKSSEANINNIFDNRTLNKALINQKIESESIVKADNTVISNEAISIKNTVEKKITDIVEIIVPKEVVPSLQSKIIGAQQKMGSFMNDVARNMYLNYKPPVTAFRVNLNPANLGSISIIMKANKVDNSLNVSMNLSNSNTMEAMSENKVALQTAIQRQFNDSSNVSINFSMENDSSENSFDQGNNNQNQENNKNNEQDEIDLNNNEEQEIIENNDYM